MASRRLLPFLTHRPFNIFRQISITPRVFYSNESGFKSSIALEKLYPNSDVDAISKVPSPPKNDPNKFSGYIPTQKISITYSRASGPGGMNVNKLNTKATLTFKVSEADWIPDKIRINFIEKFKNQITRDGSINVTSDRTRYQHLNTADVFQKLREMIRACEPVEHVVNFEAEEKARKGRERAARERLIVKRRRGQVKSSRGAV